MAAASRGARTRFLVYPAMRLDGSERDALFVWRERGDIAVLKCESAAIRARRGEPAHTLVQLVERQFAHDESEVHRRAIWSVRLMPHSNRALPVRRALPFGRHAQRSGELPCSLTDLAVLNHSLDKQNKIIFNSICFQYSEALDQPNGV